jgi:exodeoxyribonuclease VIII
MGVKTMTYDGIVEITNDEYHGSEGYSKSALIVYRDSPVRFYHEYILGNKQEKESASFLLGNLVHAYTLEPDTINDIYHIYEHINRTTKDGKLQEKALEAFKNQGFTLVDKKIADKAKAMAETILADSVAQSIIKGAQVEQSIYWTDKDTGLLFKSRPDIIKSTVVADIKTTDNLSVNGFSRSCMDYGYFLQAGMAKLALQAHGIEMEKFVFICINKTEPFEVMTYILDDNAIEYGVNQFKWLSGRLEQDLKENDWLKPRVKVLDVPKWAEWE